MKKFLFIMAYSLLVLQALASDKEKQKMAQPPQTAVPSKKPKYKRCEDSQYCTRIRSFVTNRNPSSPSFFYYVDPEEVFIVTTP